MAAGTKHFMFNRPDDWTGQGVADGLSAESGGLALQKAGKGVYVSFALDTLEKETVWHRLRVTADIPGNTLLRLYLYCSDDDSLPAGFGPPDEERRLDDWLADPAVTAEEREQFFMTFSQRICEGPQDLLLYDLRGRYLWFCLVFFSYGGETLSVSSTQLDFPRIALIDYLPQVYRGAESVNSFLARFISVFQSVYVDLEEDIDLAPTRFDPAVAPPEFLYWLADGLAVSDCFLWTEQKLRELMQSAVRLYRIKGTKPALQEVIQLYTGQKPLIIEQFETASSELWKADGETLRRLYGGSSHTFTVLMPQTDCSSDEYAKLYRVIEKFKPVDAICNLVFLENVMILGRHCYLGVNSRIGRSEELVLDTGASAPGAPYLTE